MCIDASKLYPVGTAVVHDALGLGTVTGERVIHDEAMIVVDFGSVGERLFPSHVAMNVLMLESVAQQDQEARAAQDAARASE